MLTEGDRFDVATLRVEAFICDEAKVRRDKR
jgi:hypothetical protein